MIFASRHKSAALVCCCWFGGMLKLEPQTLLIAGIAGGSGEPVCVHELCPSSCKLFQEQLVVCRKLLRNRQELWISLEHEIRLEHKQLVFPGFFELNPTRLPR